MDFTSVEDSVEIAVTWEIADAKPGSVWAREKASSLFEQFSKRIGPRYFLGVYTRAIEGILLIALFKRALVVELPLGAR